MAKIQTILARQILDSRGNPTIEVDISLEKGGYGRAAVPSGASTGSYEAIELRDKNQNAYHGKSVFNAVNNVNSIIKKAITGINFNSYNELDNLLIELDGTINKGHLGANAILGTSMAFVHAQANQQMISLFELLLQDRPVLPVPMMNIINGGSHADNNIDIQEFMIFPLGAESFSHSLQMGIEVFHNLKTILQSQGYHTSIGDEGGFAPNLSSNESAIEVIMDAIHKSGYIPGKDIFIALDVAASELFNSNNQLYMLKSENKNLDYHEMINYYSQLCDNYPIISIEDGLDENDWDGWVQLYKSLGSRIQLVGDDLTVTNPERLKSAIEINAMNAILIKLNQIGTITETINTINMAKKANYGSIISHRSGETEDTTIADFSVAMGVGQIKTGSVSRTDRTCKYNQLLRIEQKLQHANPLFGGMDYLGHILNEKEN
tara:strand:+ start:2171 stop:3475 length:1305 start_codon:yes stop_codon:yes gene_type:complete